MYQLICSNCGKQYESKEKQRYKNCFCCKKCESEFRKTMHTRPKKKNEIIIKETYAIIKINNNKLGLVDCFIDVEDVEKVQSYYWNLKIDNRHPNLKPYVETHRRKERIFLHKLLTDCPQGKVVDHIDGNPLNNIKSNLTVCTQKENTYNHHFAQNIHYVKRDDLYTVHFAIEGKIKTICYTRDIKEAEFYAALGREFLKKGQINTLLTMPCKKIIPRNNKTGIIGVTQLKNGKYQAFFKGKHLGTYINIEDAKNARKQAEINYQLQNL